jgi:Domain of unkown function (DUF1775)
VRNRFRLSTISVLAGLGVLVLAGPAAAHVEVSADKKQAGASDVTLSFRGEAENDSAGIRSERVVLPEGIAPEAVTLVKAPSGWAFTRTGDGFTVGGKALRTGTDAAWQVKIAKLPDGVTRLPFKTLETYGDGQISRWIEVPEEGAAEPDNPAPMITLRPGPATAPSAAPVSSAPGTAPAGSTPSAPATVDAGPAARTSDDGTGTWWVWIVVAVLVLGGGAVVLARRRRN